MDAITKFRRFLQSETKPRPRRHSQTGEKQTEEERAKEDVNCDEATSTDPVDKT